MSFSPVKMFPSSSFPLLPFKQPLFSPLPATFSEECLEGALAFTKGSAELLLPRHSFLLQGWEMVRHSSGNERGAGVLVMASSPIFGTGMAVAALGGVTLGSLATAGAAALQGVAKLGEVVGEVWSGEKQSVQDLWLMALAHRVQQIQLSRPTEKRHGECRPTLVSTVVEALLEWEYEIVRGEVRKELPREREALVERKDFPYLRAAEKVRRGVRGVFEERELAWSDYRREVNLASKEWRERKAEEPYTPAQQALFHGVTLAQEVVSDPCFMTEISESSFYSL